MTTESTDPTVGTDPIADLSYEDARDELVSIVSRIEGGSASLEESMKLWERGEALAAHCQDKLNQAQEQLDRSVAPAEGAPASASAEVDSTDEDAASTDEGAAAADDD